MVHKIEYLLKLMKPQKMMKQMTNPIKYIHEHSLPNFNTRNDIHQIYNKEKVNKNKKLYKKSVT